MAACCWCHRELQEDPFWLACNDCGKTELLQKLGNFRTLNFFTCRTKLSSVIPKPAAVRNKNYHFRSELLHIMRTYSAMICSHWRPVAFWTIASSLGPLEAGDWCRLICSVSITDWLQYVDLMLVTMNSVPLIMNFTSWSQSLYRCHSIYNLMIGLPDWALIRATDLISSNDQNPANSVKFMLFVPIATLYTETNARVHMREYRVLCDIVEISLGSLYIADFRSSTLCVLWRSAYTFCLLQCLISYILKPMACSHIILILLWLGQTSRGHLHTVIMCVCGGGQVNIYI